MICDMSDEEQPESFENKLRALARELSESVERAAEQLDVDGVADQIALGGERVRELAESAGRWLNQFQGDGSKDEAGAKTRGRLRGPHPLDIPTEDQALALSALASGRWRVAPGTNEVAAEDDGPAPEMRDGTVAELRARDWIAASGEVTPLGHEALKRWSDTATGAAE
jgi:hypothetical protein